MGGKLRFRPFANSRACRNRPSAERITCGLRLWRAGGAVKRWGGPVAPPCNTLALRISSAGLKPRAGGLCSRRTLYLILNKYYFTLRLFALGAGRNFAQGVACARLAWYCVARSYFLAILAQVCARRELKQARCG